MKYDTPFKVCDPVHGFIRLNSLERQLIDSLPFQRLRYIKQMGMAYLVYPSATHTRFEHSLGVMHLADRIFTTLFSWDEPPVRQNYLRQILRLAALTHDLGHLPFSHTAEKALLPHGGHEEMTRRILESDELASLWQQVGPNALEDILKIALSNHEFTLSEDEALLSTIVTDDNFGADRIDYLLRDAYSTGAGYGIFDAHQLIDSLRIVYQQNPCIGVQYSGLQSVESLWVARYMMISRVSHHPKVRLYSYHMTKVMDRYHQEVPFTNHVVDYLQESDDTVMAVVRKMAKEKDYDAQVVLLQARSYQNVFWQKKISEEKVLEQFAPLAFFDSLERKEGRKIFPVLIDHGQVISSEQAAPFLANIPSGAPGPYLFVHPRISDQVMQYLEANGEYDPLAMPQSTGC